MWAEGDDDAMARAGSAGAGRRAIGLCPLHGRVDGVKEFPQPSFPFVVYAARRLAVRLGPFRCPECGQRLGKGADVAPPVRVDADERRRADTAPKRRTARAVPTFSGDGKSAVCVRGLVKSYSGVPAVEGIDLDIARGEIFALLGPNGAGKTTTIEILEGYRPRDDGDVAVLGCDPGR